MPTLDIEGHKVAVDDAFLKLSPEEQNRTVDEIAASLKIGKSEPVGVNDVVRSAASGVPIVGGLLNKANAATNALVAPVVEPFLAKGADTLDQPTFGERYQRSLDIQNKRDTKFSKEHPIVDTAAKVAGGVGALVPAIAAAPAAFGATGTMAQMVTRGAASGAALSAADAAVRGHDVAQEAGVGAVLGAAGGPIGKAIGRVAEKIASRHEPMVPQNTANAGGVDIPLPPQDVRAAGEIELARKGGRGDPAKAVVDDADAATAAALERATQNIAADLGKPVGVTTTGTGPNAGAVGRAATPDEAANLVRSHVQDAEQTRFQTEQARMQRAAAEGEQLRGGLAPDEYTGQPMVRADSPYVAGEAIGGAVTRERDAARRTVRGNYEEANATPGAFDPTVPRTMAEEIRARLNQGNPEHRLWVDPDSTGLANQALKTLDKDMSEGLFANSAAMRGGAGGPASRGVPSDAEAAYSRLTAEGVAPDRARAAVANLPGADALPRGPMEPHSVATAAGGAVEVAPKVVEASSVKTSADPGYLADLQPRNRQRAASDMQITGMAKNITPNRLGVSTEADRGAPIIGPDGMVESGNGRVLALRQAYAQGGAQAQKYRQWLEAQGVDTAGMKEPILVRERTTPMSHDERKAFTVAANQSSTLSLSGAERALADSRALSADTLGLVRNAGDLGAVENRDFVRQFMQALPQTERASLMTASGDLSSEGLTRIRNAVMAKAYGNSSILARAAESTKDEIKAISNGLQSAAPEWAQLRSAVAAGQVSKEMDATAHLLDAVERTARIRGKGTSLAEGLAQSDAFAAQSPESEAFMRLFFDADGKRAASSAQVGNALRNYAQEAIKVDAAPGLNLGMAPVTARDVLASTSAKVGAPAKLAQEISDLAAAPAEKAAAADATIPEIGVREMDNARKRLNVLRGEAYDKKIRTGDGADARAMDRIIDEFDAVIRDAHKAGLFSGDSVEAQRLIENARRSHSEYRQTFTSRGGSDPVGRQVEKILGKYNDTAATPDEIAKMAFGDHGNPGGGDAIRINERLRQILGPTSPEWGAHKQGLFSYLVDPPPGTTWTATQRADRIEKFLTGTKGRGLAGTMLSAEERAGLANHAQNLRASEPVAIESLKGVDRVLAKISGRLDGVPSSNEEIIKFMWGGAKDAGGKSLSVELARRLEREMTPEAFGTIRESLLHYVMKRPEGVTEWGPKLIADNIHKLRNSSLGVQMYTREQLSEIGKLADAIKATVPPAGATNPSGTSHMIQRMLRGMSSLFLPALGAATHGPMGIVVGMGATKAAGAAQNAKAARDVKRLYYGPQASGPVDPRFARIGALLTRGAGQGRIENRQ